MPRIDQLPAGSTPVGTEEAAVMQGGVTARLPVSALAPVRSVAGRTGAVVLAAADIVSGVLARARLGTGTADSTTVLYGDGTWKAAPTGGGSGITAVTGTAPIASSGGAAPDISIAAATTASAGSMAPAAVVKLNGIAAGATANSPDATLLARANHTGTQPASSISDLAAAVRALKPAIRTVTAATSLSAADDILRVNASSAVTVMVPTGITAIVTVLQIGAGQVTVAAGSGVTFTAGLPTRTSGQGQAVTIIPRGTDTHDVVGGVA